MPGSANHARRQGREGGQRDPRGDQRADRGEGPQRIKKKPWQLASVKFAIFITALGLALSIYALATRPDSSSATRDAARTDSTKLKSGLADSDPSRNSSAAAEEEPANRRAVDSAAPATLRLGASFLGAFTIGYFMRKFLRWTMLIMGIAVVAIFFLRKSGVINLPWDQIEGQVHDGASWLQAQAGSVKDVLTGYLPSGAAALFGGVIGFWRG
jgi:uncharacterized membrane protein (Fun14 family)